MKREFHEGDVVRVRQWDDMEMEFGLSDYGSIACLFTFTDQMKCFCGFECVIAKILSDRRIHFDSESIVPTDESHAYLTGNMRHFSWSADMLEPVDSSFSSEDVSSDELFSILESQLGGD